VVGFRGFECLRRRAENRKVAKDRRWMAARQGDREVLQFSFEGLVLRSRASGVGRGKSGDLERQRFTRVENLRVVDRRTEV
jgi:hypothetical protein